MLIIVLTMQGLLTAVLNQAHQQVISQFDDTKYPVPIIHPNEWREVINQVELIRPIYASGERQFYSAQMSVCEENNCYLVEHIISVKSAILKEDIKFHAKQLK